MKRVDKPEIGKTYITSLFHHSYVDVVGIYGDYVLAQSYCFNNGGIERTDNKECKLHKSLLFHCPESWKDLPVENILTQAIQHINWNTRLRRDDLKFKADNLNKRRYVELFEDLRKQPFRDSLKIALPKCNFKQLCSLRNLFGKCNYTDDSGSTTRLSVTKERKGELTAEQIEDIEDLHGLYLECYKIQNSVKYSYSGLEWRKHTDISDLSHPLYGLNELLTNEKFYTMMLFPENDTRVFNAIHLCSKSFNHELTSLDGYIEGMEKCPSLDNGDNSFNSIIEYFMLEGLISDQFHNKIAVPDFVNPDSVNSRYLKRSVNNNWFRYLIYITGHELKELWETKVNKELADRQAWSYILNGNGSIRYYLWIR